MDINFDMPKNRSNVIKVIGVGGGGSNAINHMFQQGIDGVDFVVCNTDSQALDNSSVPTKVQLGVNLTEGLGAGANPEVGEQAALESFEDLKVLLDSNTKMVFITAGMGGGTGTGAAPIIAKQARDMEILTVGIVTIPFKFEGRVRNEQAQLGVEKLRRNVDSLIVIDNNKLREVYGNLGFKSGFSKADEVLATASRGIAEVITHHYTQNIDLKDAKTVLSNSGTAIMGSAVATGGNRAQEAISQALDSPLLNDNKIAGAKNVLLLIVSGTEEITLDEIGEVNDHIQAEAGNSANIIMGVGEDADLGESIAVTIIATGFNPDQQNEIVNTESKKIIHTLEDEQKAVQNLSPENSSISSIVKKRPVINKPESAEKSTPSKTTSIEGSQQGNAVYSLTQDEKPAKKKRAKSGMNLVPTTEIICDLTVNYQEVTYEEDDFVFIDTDDDFDDEGFAIESSETSDVDEDALFQFDMPKSTTPSSQESASNRRSQPARSSRSPQNRAQDSEQKYDVENQVDLFPGNPADSEGKRYSLEDYMEKEQELTDAQPEEDPENSPQLYKKHDLEEPYAEPTPKEQISPENEEVDPLNSPISNEMAARASERRARLKKFNYKFRNNSSIEEIEKQPAYKRAGVDLHTDAPLGQGGNLSRSTISDDNDQDGPQLRSNNSFLHDNVD